MLQGIVFLKHAGNRDNDQFKDSLLCWKTAILAPDALAPVTMEEWFNESLISSVPCNRYRKAGSTTDQIRFGFI